MRVTCIIATACWFLFPIPFAAQAQATGCDRTGTGFERAICDVTALNAFASRLDNSRKEAIEAGLAEDTVREIDQRHALLMAECEGVLCWGRHLLAADNERRNRAGMKPQEWIGYMSALEDISAGQAAGSAAVISVGPEGWACDLEQGQLTCINVIGQPIALPATAERDARAKQTLILLGCAAAPVDGELTPASLSCYNNLVGRADHDFRPDDLIALSRSSFAADGSDAMRQLAARGVRFADAQLTDGPMLSIEFPLSLDNVPPVPAAKDDRSTVPAAADRRADGKDAEASRWTHLRQGLSILGCATEPSEVEWQFSEIHCVQRMFGFPEGLAQAEVVKIVDIAAGASTIETALLRLESEGFRRVAEQPSTPPPTRAAPRIPPQLQAAVDLLDIDHLTHVAALAQQGTDPNVTASLPETAGQYPRETPAVLVSIKGKPAFVYFRKLYGASGSDDWRMTFAMRCRGDRRLDLFYTLWLPPSEEDLVRNVLKELGAGADMSLELSPAGQDITLEMPAGPVIVSESGGLVIRAFGTTDSDNSFFHVLRGTSNLAAMLKKDGVYLGPRDGVDLTAFRQSVAPLLESCRAGDANPMDGGYEFPPADGQPKPLARQTAEVDLPFLPAASARHFQRIYQGQPARYDESFPARLITPFAFHLGYSRTCVSATAMDIEFHAGASLERYGLVGIPSADYGAFVVGTSVYDRLSRIVYDDQTNPDFSFDQVRQIHDTRLDEEVSEWEAVFRHYGCQGDVATRFRENIQREMPFFEHQSGSARVLVDFGHRTYSVDLAHGIDVDQARQVGHAEHASRDDMIFTDSYAGKVLRAVAIGNFPKVTQIEAGLRDAISSPFRTNGDTVLSRAIDLVATVEHGVKRQSNIFTAYALARMQLLGSCGDALSSYRQESVYWTEYTNGFGQSTSSREDGRRVDVAQLPSKFDGIVKAQNSIDTSRLLEGEMARMVNKLTCDSPIRHQLEANMLAYFNGADPAVIAPLSVR